jgi:hypothetical protein
MQQDVRPALEVVQKTELPGGIRLELAVAEPTVEFVDTRDGSQAMLLNLPMGGAVLDEGYPAVPIAGRMFRLPPTGGVEVEVTNTEYQTFTDIEYATYLGHDGEDIFGSMTQAMNHEDAWFPSNIAEAGDPAIFHDFRVSNLRTHPVQVNPARREVRVYSQIDVDLHFNSEDDRNSLDHWPTTISSNFLPFYRNFMDWEESELDEYTIVQGSVQVVVGIFPHFSTILSRGSSGRSNWATSWSCSQMMMQASVLTPPSVAS